MRRTKYIVFSSALGVAVLGVLGCIADLRRIHTSDLLEVSPQQLQRAREAVLPELPPRSDLARGCWQIHASLDFPHHAIDQDPTTLAAAPNPSQIAQFILLDLGEMTTVTQIIQVHPEDGGEPGSFRIDVADDHNFPYTLAVIDHGEPGRTVSSFRKTHVCRFLRITLLEPMEHPWRIVELDVR